MGAKKKKKSAKIYSYREKFGIIINLETTLQLSRQFIIVLVKNSFTSNLFWMRHWKLKNNRVDLERKNIKMMVEFMRVW